MAGAWWNQIYDPKEGRPLRRIPPLGECKTCGQWNGHRLDCPEVTMEHLAKMVLHAQSSEESAKRTSKRYWEQLQRAIGKVAILRHENNKIRKANEKIRADLKRLQS